MYGNYYPPHTNSMGKIARGVNKIHITMLYGNYCYIFIENFRQKFAPRNNISKKYGNFSKSYVEEMKKSIMNLNNTSVIVTF